jgi:hypothetical protein
MKKAMNLYLLKTHYREEKENGQQELQTKDDCIVKQPNENQKIAVPSNILLKKATRIRDLNYTKDTYKMFHDSEDDLQGSDSYKSLDSDMSSHKSSCQSASKKRRLGFMDTATTDMSSHKSSFQSTSKKRKLDFMDTATSSRYV